MKFLSAGSLRSAAVLSSYLLAAGSCSAQASEAKVRPAEYRITAERVKLPGNENMGLVGTSYLLDVGHGFRVGPGVYGAASGQRGGLLVVGAELGWRQRLVGPLELELGVYGGGGGGGAAPVGGGFQLRTHADLLWNIDDVRLGISASRVRFPNGAIDSSQLALVLNLPTEFRYRPRGEIGEGVTGRRRSGLGFDRLQAVVGAYKPRKGSTRVSGPALTGRITTVGVRAEQAVSSHLYWGWETAGAASGGVGGYAEYLASLGTETALVPGTLAVGARAAIGMGGGGDVDTGGGLLLRGGVYSVLRLTRSLGFTLEGGYTAAPQGSFKALHAMGSLVWLLDTPEESRPPSRTTRSEWAFGVEHMDAARKDGTVRDLQLNVLKVSRFITPSFFLTGQAHGAWGGNAGGYTAGLFGPGLQLQLSPSWHAGLEMLVGAGAGGGIDTGSGAIGQAMAYVGADITRDLSLRLSGGRIKSGQGRLDASVAQATLVFSFGTGERED